MSIYGLRVEVSRFIHRESFLGEVYLLHLLPVTAKCSNAVEIVGLFLAAAICICTCK